MNDSAGREASRADVPRPDASRPEAPGAEAPGVVVTGARGFAGRHLMRHLAEIGFPALPAEVRLPDRAAMSRLLTASRPRALVHLAAVSFLPAAERDPAAAIETNLDGTRSVLEGLRDADPDGDCRMVFISTGHVYRPAPGEPLVESSPLDPPTAYGRTKLAAELLCRMWCEADPPRPLWIFRPFNHTGPGQRPDFAAPGFARQVARIERGLSPPVLLTGDLRVTRDFCDVRDVVRAYAGAAAGMIPPGTYNLASGRSLSLKEIAEHYRSRSLVPLEVREQLEPGRAGEIREVRGSAERIRRACGWRAEVPIEKTLDDLLEEWRARTPE